MERKVCHVGFCCMTFLTTALEFQTANKSVVTAARRGSYGVDAFYFPSRSLSKTVLDLKAVSQAYNCLRSCGPIRVGTLKNMIKTIIICRSSIPHITTC